MVTTEVPGAEPQAVRPDVSGVREAVAAPIPVSVGAQRGAIDAANRALTLASLTLAPERDELADPQLARALLREAFIRAARAAGPAEQQLAFPFAGEPSSLRAARAVLEGRADLPKRFSRLLELSRELEGEGAPEVPRLRELEAQLARLLRHLAADKREWLRSRWALAGGVVALALLVVFVPRLVMKPSWTEYKWQVSSTFSDFPMSGTLAEGKEVLFHTASQRGPWVIIDMNEPRTISEVLITNRKDCCAERAVPLIAEVSTDGKTFSFVGFRDKVFAEWTLSFKPQRVRYVRLRVDAETFLHLAEVQIR